ncbi:hypothetical protein GDO86_003008 [Hymenochirus boettgeri]|uniref:Dehydrogenase/reductase (SDR family) X-linked n=1 Tax=Hymenochirus boettgeri TaxID=247094 RepID=A0A8T2K1T2_9PIPI|nr:hypothetical protein GDO86_003008 [Hymenochirus boettgeri]
MNWGLVSEGSVEFLYCDLASVKSIRQFVQDFKAKNFSLHILVNNAGVMLVPERKTVDGFEEHFGLNYLGHFLLTNLLLKTLKKSGKDKQCYSPHGAYAQSKLALVMFTYYLQRQLTGEGSYVTANVTVEEGAATSVYASVSPELEGVGGCYLYNGHRAMSADISYNEELQQKLWHESCKMVRIFKAE